MNTLLSKPETRNDAARTVAGLPTWDWNRRVGWISACLGVASGTIIGLWSFDGPVPVPDWLGDYGTTARRLARLGHIAFFGLGILDLLLAQELRRSALAVTLKRVASWSMIFGNVFLPLTLFAAAVYMPFKYLLPLPVLGVSSALVLAAYGACTKGREVGPTHDESQ